MDTIIIIISINNGQWNGLLKLLFTLIEHNDSFSLSPSLFYSQSQVLHDEKEIDFIEQITDFIEQITKIIIIITNSIHHKSKSLVLYNLLLKIFYFIFMNC